MSRLYFAHHLTEYGTDLERRIVRSFDRYSPGRLAAEVINPNSPEHEAHYKKLGMGYFLELARTCDGCIYLPFPDGKLGAGVAKEVQSFLDRGCLVQKVEPFCDLRAFGFTYITQLNPPQVLSVDQTRDRIRGPRSKDHVWTQASIKPQSQFSAVFFDEYPVTS